MMIRRTLLSILAMLVAYASYNYGSEVPVSTQIDLLNFLVTISSVVFGVVGIWLAVVFPDVISGIYTNRSVDEKVTLYRKAKILLVPLLLVTAVTISTITFRVLIAIVCPLGGSLRPLNGSGVLFAFIVFASIALIWSLILAIAPGLQMLFEASWAIKKSIRKNRFIGKDSGSKNNG